MAASQRRRRVPLLLLFIAVAVAYYVLTYEAPPAADAPTEVAVSDEIPEVHLVTWNLLNFGKSKDDEEVAFMADLLREADVVAIQEVNTGPDGAQAIARLADELDRRGANWDYVVSDATVGPGSERYAFLWKSSRVRRIGEAWLEPSLAEEIDREPYMARFETTNGGQRMLLASLHAVPRAKKPADEVVLLDNLHALYPDENLLVMGDFNLSQKHRAFDDLKEVGYVPVLVDQATSLRMKRKDGEYLANEYDNIFYEPEALVSSEAGVIDFVGEFRTLKQARTISDHLPVYMVIRWK